MQWAEAAAAHLDESGDLPEASYVQPGMVLAKLAEAHLSLGNTRTAVTYAEQTIAADGHQRCRVNRLATLAGIALAERDLDRVEEAVTGMLDHAAGMESSRVRSRFAGLRRGLARHDGRAAGTSAERLTEWLSVL